MLTNKHLLFLHLNLTKVTALNKRVKNYDSNYGSASGNGIAYEGIELTADKGVVAE